MKLRRTVPFLLTLMLAFPLSACRSAAAAPGSAEQASAAANASALAPAKKIVLVSVPGLSFLELQPSWLLELPGLAGLQDGASWGALNIRTPGRGLEDAYLSMGAGHFAEGGTGVQGLQAKERINGETAFEQYARYGGADREPVIVIRELEALRRANAVNYYHALPGLLGERLKASGITVSVWGNADRVIAGERLTGFKTEAGKSYRRYAPLMLMDTAGTLRDGDVSDKGLLHDAAYPAGIRTDYSWMLRRWREQPTTSVTLLEIGDLERLYDEKAAYSQAAFAEAKRRVLAELDRFVLELKRYMAEGANAQNEELWLFSPKVNADAAKEKAYLAPLLIYAPAASQPGGSSLLTSATTRREGIVSLIDLAPTLLARYGIAVPPDMIGLPMQTIGGAQAGALTVLLGTVSELQHIYRLRPPLLYGLAIYEIAVMLAVLLLALVAADKLGRRGKLLCRAALFSLLLAPAGLLSMGWMPQEPAFAAVALALAAIFAASLACAAGARTPGGLAAALAGAGLLVTLLLLYDGMQGARAMQRSVLGYDPMIGARYYGMGNEYMGVLLGAALLGLTALQQMLRRTRRAAGSGTGPAAAAAAPPKAASP
ncbi:hypothetical protein N0M98_25250, partial [Paenibacillus doosanensis]|uniref:hypothetical protein n=1 Tax=Paenibacillus doosanensis TaxID=1229154 RepID=UPI00217FC15D